jgi:hypothetical protein
MNKCGLIMEATVELVTAHCGTGEEGNRGNVDVT